MTGGKQAKSWESSWEVENRSRDKAMEVWKMVGAIDVGDEAGGAGWAIRAPPADNNANAGPPLEPLKPSRQQLTIRQHQDAGRMHLLQFAWVA